MVIAILHDGQSTIVTFGGPAPFCAGGAGVMLKTKLRVTLMTADGNGLVGGLRFIDLAL